MGALVSTIMLTALFTIPLTIAREEYAYYYASHRVPACEEINRFGTGNTTTGVLVGECERRRRHSTFTHRSRMRALSRQGDRPAVAAVRAVPHTCRHGHRAVAKPCQDDGS